LLGCLPVRHPRILPLACLRHGA